MAADDAKIIDLIKARPADAGPFVSFEFFPPRTDDGVANLLKRLDRMAAQEPLFTDFTWGAGGSTADLTYQLTLEAQKRGLLPNMHLTCTNMDAALIKKALDDCKANGIRNICALRGDPPVGSDNWSATEGGFNCALDLIAYMRAEYGDYFGISCAGYPEGHPNRIKKVEAGRVLTATEEGRKVTLMEKVEVEGGGGGGGGDGAEEAAEEEEVTYVCGDADFEEELAYLKQKVDAGAEFIMTQMFFDPAVFTAFVAACRAYGIAVPIVPGLMCIQAKGGFNRMTGFCRSRVPAALKAEVDACTDDTATKVVGVAHGAATCSAIQGVVPGFHFYTLNLEKVTLGIVRELGLAKATDEEALAYAAAKQESIFGATAATAAASADAPLSEDAEAASMMKGTTMGGTDNVKRA